MSKTILIRGKAGSKRFNLCKMILNSDYKIICIDKIKVPYKEILTFKFKNYLVF